VASLHLPDDPVSVGRARQFIREFCQAAGLSEENCQTAALLVSELVTNAIIHGRTSAQIDAHRPGAKLRVSVRDDNPDLPPVGNRPPLTAESGRGLTIVSMLASRWGIEARGKGKAIWFELDTAGS
jgi:anti-sigma regulatory factor (Ser/Thr protein kinase)